MVAVRTNGKVLQELRVKVCNLPLSTLQLLLTMDGQYSLKMVGWPEGARIIGADVQPEPVPMVRLLLTHPDFPLCLSGEPPQIKIDATRVD